MSLQTATERPAEPQRGGTDKMDKHGANTRKVAVAVALGLAAVLIVHDGDLSDPAGSWYPMWRKAGLMGAPARAVACVTAGVCLLVLGWLYRLLFSPLELLRAPEDVGYIAEAGRSRAQAANEVRRRRKTGELPPVYPNGWYRALDSLMLDRGEVKNVSLLGMERKRITNVFDLIACTKCKAMRVN